MYHMYIYIYPSIIIWHTHTHISLYTHTNIHYTVYKHVYNNYNIHTHIYIYICEYVYIYIYCYVIISTYVNILYHAYVAGWFQTSRFKEIQGAHRNRFDSRAKAPTCGHPSWRAPPQGLGPRLGWEARRSPEIFGSLDEVWMFGYLILEILGGNMREY